MTERGHGVVDMANTTQANAPSDSLVQFGHGGIARCVAVSGQRGQHDLAGGACQNADTSKRRRSSEPSGKLIDHLRSAHYMPNRLLAPVEYAQAAIKSVAI